MRSYLAVLSAAKSELEIL